MMNKASDVYKYIVATQMLTLGEQSTSVKESSEKFRELMYKEYVMNEEKDLLLGQLNDALYIYNKERNRPRTKILSICDKCRYYVADEIWIPEIYGFNSLGSGCVGCIEEAWE